MTSFKGKSQRQNGSGRKHMMGENVKRHDTHLREVAFCDVIKRRMTSCLTLSESLSFRSGSFWPNLGVGRFGLGRWVDSALAHFGPVLFRPKIDR